MPERAISLESAFLAGTLAAATLLGLNTTASSAAECLEHPDARDAGPSGHWYYHTDQRRNRRCWFFVASEATADTPASAPPPSYAPQVNAQPGYAQPGYAPPAYAPPAYAPQTAPVSGNPLSWIPFLDLFSPPPQQGDVAQTQPNPTPDSATTDVTSSNAARPARTVRRARPQNAPPPATTTGAADLRDQPGPPAGGEKQSDRDQNAGNDKQHDQPDQNAGNEKQDGPINQADREALFQDFMKWQLNRNLFGDR